MQKFVSVSNKEGVAQGGSELTYGTPCLPSYYMCVRFKMSSSLEVFQEGSKKRRRTE